MQLTPEWFAAEGEDAGLLHAIHTAFAPNPPEKIGLAVSGGGDSMALLHLAARWAEHSGTSLEAVTVDHGLRPESADEAAMVAATCAELGIPHTVLRWHAPVAPGNLPAAARAARYTLMADWAKPRSIGLVALGHTQDDIAETFLMRLSRQAGLDGLAAMEPHFTRHGLAWARPLWQHSRAALRDYLTRHATPWVDDPTNEDPAYDRTRARRALATLAELNISAADIAHSSSALGQARAALEHYARDEAKRRIVADRGDYLLTLSPPLPQDMERRLLNAVLVEVGGGAYPPRWAALMDMQAQLAGGGQHTLAGCLITREGATLRITREAGALCGLVCLPSVPWDGRWRLTGGEARQGMEIRLLGKALAQCPGWRETGLPRASLLASPALWQGDTLIAAPLAGLTNGWRAEVVRRNDHDFAALLSH